MSTKKSIHKLSLPMVLVTIGIVFGDIGTSPLYVMSAIIGDRVISKELIYGGVSCVFWTLTLITTVKYVLLVLRADNKGEGGVFALYALVRKRARWLVIPAIIGGSTLLSDGMLTPAISVSSAVEGLHILSPHINTVPIVLVIITLLFLFQRAGTRIVGSSFGPITTAWFVMLAILGAIQIVRFPQIVEAIHPRYALELLLLYPQGFWLLGAVFLCTTGADALYSDLGHCGKKNIRAAWSFVKLCLLLNYFGQAAWLVQFEGYRRNDLGVTNPLYGIMPSWFVPIGIVIATAATVIASQAMITGAFSLVNEAMRLNLWPKARVLHPTEERGQLFIPSINGILFVGCAGVVLYFQESERMEAAYGLAINITMIVTTILLSAYAYVRRGSYTIMLGIGLTFLAIEGMFLIANLAKFPHGGFVAILTAMIFGLIQFIWYKARKIKNRFLEFGPMDKLLPRLVELSEDQSVPKFASHLVFMTSANYPSQIESKFEYSIFSGQPKRADTYWFVHVDVVDEPYTCQYEVTILVPNLVYRIDLRLGFRIEPRVNMMLRKVIEEMVAKGEVDITSRYESLNKMHLPGDFRFVVLEKFLSYENDLPFWEKLIMDLYFLLKKISLSEGREFGLDPSMVTIEKVPLLVSTPRPLRLERTNVTTQETVAEKEHLS
ncbi:MAG: KUP/HAK/KT family potassium transporter [Chitinophagales bacterium]|nr:KUP/HAK/KT family potassium transporter [Chitinophagales bacterium]